MIDHRPFGVTSRGDAVSLFEVRRGGLALRCMEYGGAVLALEVPDRQGRLDNVLLAYDDLRGYEEDRCWCAMACGPVAGRIAGASVALDGVRHELEANDGTACLHGGPLGLSHRIWRGRPFRRGDQEGVSLALSTDFLGAELDLELSYSLDSRGRLTVGWRGRASAPTLLAPTFHGYVNLGGPGRPSVREHRLTLNCDRYMPLDGLEVSGHPRSVAGTPFDLRDSRLLGETPGYDNGFLRSHDDGAPVAVLEDDATGRRLEVTSDQPCLVVYTGGGLDGGQVFSGGRSGAPFLAVALESQWYPNVARCGVPLPILRPGEAYSSRTVWRFSVL